jgi:2-polyprenyl-6-methoxyphenol hydroxylase-like FAD-dependent oxidoreductase
VLLGDSCHATTPTFGQGANMSIDDAVTLAIFLENSLKKSSDVNSAVTEAFTSYFKERQPKVTKMVQQSRAMQDIEVSAGFRAKMRDFQMKAMTGIAR